MDSNLSQNSSSSAILNNTNNPQTNLNSITPVTSPLQSSNSTNILDSPSNLTLIPTTTVTTTLSKPNKNISHHKVYFNWLYFLIIIILLILAIVIFIRNKKNVENTSYDN